MSVRDFVMGVNPNEVVTNTESSNKDNEDISSKSESEETNGKTEEQGIVPV